MVSMIVKKADETVGGSVQPASIAPSISIRVENVSHWFESPSGAANIVLRDISLDIAPGEFVSLVGPSGCGKTTLLNMIAGVTKPKLGVVRITRANAPSVASPMNSLGYMQARDALMPWRTLTDNVILGLQFQRVPRSERRARAQEALAMVGLGEVGDRYPRQLSHGMRQRGNLARLFATRPEVLLMDEPFGALDAQTKFDLQLEFGQLWRNTSASVVFVTHDLGEAILLGDRVVVMAEGEATEDIRIPFGRPRDLESIRYDPEFQTLVRDLVPLLRKKHGSG
jgi:NitT/TauT family transport system ATP-binding protein